MISNILLMFGCEFLAENEPNYCQIIGRVFLGIAYGLAQMSVIAYASETITKYSRLVFLGLIGFVNGISVLATMAMALCAVGYADNYAEIDIHTDRRIVLDNVQQNTIHFIQEMLYFILILAMMNLIIAKVFARESIPQLIRRGKISEALQEYKKLHRFDEEMPMSHEKFDQWKMHILANSDTDVNIFSK